MEITTIAFDADDTLWENEHLYLEAQQGFQRIMAPWGNQERNHDILYEIEMRNLPIYGYGIKAFCLSLIEAAIKISKGDISAAQIEGILAIGRDMLQAEVKLLSHVPEVLQELNKHYRLMVITKGDLLDQTAKVTRSGLTEYFTDVEVLNHKTQEEYAAILARYSIPPGQFLMVGNSLRSDILPVLELGGIAVHVPTDVTWAHEHIEDFDRTQPRFFELAHLGQLPDLIKEHIGEVASGPEQ